MHPHTHTSPTPQFQEKQKKRAELAAQEGQERRQFLLQQVAEKTEREKREREKEKEYIQKNCEMMTVSCYGIIIIIQ